MLSQLNSLPLNVVRDVALTVKLNSHAARKSHHVLSADQLRQGSVKRFEHFTVSDCGVDCSSG